MNRRRCIDSTCPGSKESTICDRKHFFNHVIKKSTEKLIDILNSNNLVKTPEALSRYTLVNLIIDFSTEPLASAILDDDT